MVGIWGFPPVLTVCKRKRPQKYMGLLRLSLVLPLGNSPFPWYVVPPDDGRPLPFCSPGGGSQTSVQADSIQGNTASGTWKVWRVCGAITMTHWQVNQKLVHLPTPYQVLRTYHPHSLRVLVAAPLIQYFTTCSAVCWNPRAEIPMLPLTLELENRSYNSCH